MSIRPNIFNAFLLDRRLFQQWIVDSYVKVDKNRIEYVRNNQKQLLVDHSSNNANNIVTVQLAHLTCEGYIMMSMHTVITYAIT